MPLTANVWRGPHAAGVQPALITKCALRYVRVAGAAAALASSPSTVTLLCVPAHSDLRGADQATPRDQVEVPAGTGVFYLVQSVTDVAKGFPNEYRIAVLARVSSPFPPIPLP